jgi:hypothetical protein
MPIESPAVTPPGIEPLPEASFDDRSCDAVSPRRSLPPIKLRGVWPPKNRTASKGLARAPQKRFSEMESEKACDYNDHHDYADDVENIHRSAPIEECATSARPVSVPWM